MYNIIFLTILGSTDHDMWSETLLKWESCTRNLCINIHENNRKVHVCVLLSFKFPKILVMSNPLRDVYFQTVNGGNHIPHLPHNFL